MDSGLDSSLKIDGPTFVEPAIIRVSITIEKRLIQEVTHKCSQLALETKFPLQLWLSSWAITSTFWRSPLMMVGVAKV